MSVRFRQTFAGILIRSMIDRFQMFYSHYNRSKIKVQIISGSKLRNLNFWHHVQGNDSQVNLSGLFLSKGSVGQILSRPFYGTSELVGSIFQTVFLR